VIDGDVSISTLATGYVYSDAGLLSIAPNSDILNGLDEDSNGLTYDGSTVGITSHNALDGIDGSGTYHFSLSQHGILIGGTSSNADSLHTHDGKADFDHEHSGSGAEIAIVSIGTTPPHSTQITAALVSDPSTEITVNCHIADGGQWLDEAVPYLQDNDPISVYLADDGNYYCTTVFQKMTETSTGLWTETLGVLSPTDSLNSVKIDSLPTGHVYSTNGLLEIATNSDILEDLGADSTGLTYRGNPVGLDEASIPPHNNLGGLEPTSGPNEYYHLTSSQHDTLTNAQDASSLHSHSNYITGNQTITLEGDVTGSGTTLITTTVANDSHSHSNYLLNNGDDSTSGNLTALSFVKSGGTSSQFLKANGSVDSNTYLTTSALTDYFHKTNDDTDDINVGTTNKFVTSSQITDWNSALSHLSDNSQAHTDYLINNGDDSTSGTLTAAGFIGKAATIGGTGTGDGVLTLIQNGSGTQDPKTIYEISSFEWAMGIDDGVNKLRISRSTSLSSNVWLEVDSSRNAIMNGDLTVTGSLTALSFVKSGGTSSQFLKADGTVDSSVYLTTTLWERAGDVLSPLNTNDNVTINGHLSATTKSFLINHPTKQGYKLQYGSLESPYHGVRLTGNDLVRNNECKVNLPSYISALVDHEDVNIQLTNINHTNILFVKEINVKDNYFIIGSKNRIVKSCYEFYWVFTAVRKDIAPLNVEYKI
jgi:hypothetical protein